MNILIKVLLLVAVSTISMFGDSVTIDTIKGKVTVPKNPKKIMVFDFAVLDTLDALNIKDTKLGVPLSSLPLVYKNYKSKVTDLGGIKDPNIEKVFMFKPDIIFINGRTAALYDELKTIAPTVYIQLDYKDYINSSKKLSRQLAKIFDKEQMIEDKLTTIDKKVQTILDISNKSDKRSLIILTNNGKISTYAKGSRFGFVYSNLGLKPVDENIKPSKHGQGINYEYISQKDPDILLYIDRTLIGGGTSFASKTLDNDLVQNTKAGKTDKIVALDSENWYMMPGGLKAINIQLDEITKAIQ